MESDLEERKRARRRSICNRELLLASSSDDLKEVELLITQGADVNFRDRDGNTPLHLAVESGDKAVIKLLLSKGAVVSIENNQKETVVHLAERLMKQDIMKILKGKQPKQPQNKKPSDKQTPDQDAHLSKKNINKIQQCEAVKRDSQNRQTQLVNAVHGNIYQLKVLMLFLYRGVSRKYSFRLGTEIKEAEKFDDLVFEYTQDDGKVYRLLQAKHKLDESKKISRESLLNENNGDYSLKKYFLAYQAVKKEDMFKDGSIKDVTICTNINFDFENLEGVRIRVERIEENDDILDVECEEKQPVRYKLSGNVVELLKKKLDISAEYSDDEIQDFMDHLVFAVNQPNEEELGDIVKKEIGLEFYFNRTETENVYNKLFMEMLKQLQGKGKDQFLSYEEGKEFFEEARRGIPIFFGVRDPVVSFVGRVEQLQNLHKMLQGESESSESQFVCISGLGGIGKSEIARKYIREHSQSYDDKIVWINAESYQTLSESFRTLASGQLKINIKDVNGKEMKISSIVDDVYTFFSKGRSLFIFDNAEKYKCENEHEDSIRDFLPSLPPNYNRPCILITSRNQNWPKNIKILQLGVLTAEEARELIKNWLKIENDTQEEDIKELGKTLQYFPLALQQAVAYITVEDKISGNVGEEFKVRNYLERFREKEETKELLNFEFPEDSDNYYTKTLYVTWNVTLDKIVQKEDGIEALEILNIVSYLNPENIPTEMFLSLVSVRKKLGSALELLKQYSMVNCNNAMLRVHRLVQQVTRIHLKEQNREGRILRKALKLFESYNMARKNVDHTISVWNYSRKYSELIKEFVPISSYISIELIARARYEEARLFGLEVSSLLSEMNVDDPNILLHILATKSIISISVLYQGKYDIALKECEQIFNTYKNIKGPDHPNIFIVKFNIAMALLLKGKYKRALKYNQKEFSICKNTFGENHFNTLFFKEIIAVIFLKQGRFNEALKILKEICKIKETSLGNVGVRTKMYIAVALANLNKFDEALYLLIYLYFHQEINYNQTLILDKKHPIFLAIKENIAGVLWKVGTYTYALKNFQEVFDSQKNLLGEDHPEVLFTHSEIANVLLQMGKYDKALEIIQDILPKQKNSLGSNHPDTISTQHCEGLIFYDQGKYSKALQILRKIFYKRKVVLGYNHPDTLQVMNDIGNIFLQFRRTDKALNYYRKVLKVQKRNLGENHLDTLGTKNYIGMALYDKMEYDQASKIFYKVYNKLLQSFPNHPLTFTVKSNTARILVRKKMYNDALKIFNEVLNFQESNVGKEHTKTLQTRIRIAEIFLLKREHNEALKTFQVCFNVSDEVFGQEHPETLRISEIIQSLEAAIDLLNAVKNNCFEKIENLVKNSGDIHTKDNDNITLIHHAVYNSNIKIVNFLLKNGSDVTEISNQGITTLHTATSKGCKEIVQVLLQHVNHEILNDFINARTNSGGNTSLHVAAKSGFLKIVEMLLKYGAIYDIKNRENKTPLELSKKPKVIKILKLLGELFKDARNGNKEIISKLKAVQCDEFLVLTNARNEQGNTLLEVVTINKHKNIESILLEMLKDPDQNTKSLKVLNNT